jgi:hypothetical protein
LQCARAGPTLRVPILHRQKQQQENKPAIRTARPRRARVHAKDQT